MVFVLFFVIALACGIALGGQPVTVYEISDVLMGVAGGLLFLASIILIALVFGIGSEGQKRSLWRLPLLCFVTMFLGFVFGVAILSSKMENLSMRHEAVNLRLTIYAGGMIVFGLFSALCLLLAYFLAKRHNAKLPPAA